MRHFLQEGRIPSHWMACPVEQRNVNLTEASFVTITIQLFGFLVALTNVEKADILLLARIVLEFKVNEDREQILG